MFRKKKNSEIEELRKEQARTIGRMIVLGLAAAFVIVALTIAWFVNNTKVSGTGVAVSADAQSVELRTKGGAGIHDDILKKLMKKENHEQWYSVVGKALDTSPEKYAVNWLLSDQSNIGNYSGKQSDWEKYWENPPKGAERQDEAIEPGSSGKLTFYVVPKYDGTVNLNMTLSLIPYKTEGNELKEITEENDKIAKNFIDGHVLFFLEKKTDSTDDTKKKEIQWIKDGTFHITIENAVKDQEYSYTLYWCWPQSFGEAVLKAGDSYLNGRKILFSDFQNGENMRNTILLEDDLSMVKRPERYFYSNLTKNPLSTDQKELAEIRNMYNKPSKELSETAKNAFVELSSYYNQADQYIGSQVDCVRVRLTGE